MWRHAVAAVTVQVEPNAVERHAEMGDDAPGRLQIAAGVASGAGSRRKWPSSRGTSTSRSYISRRWIATYPAV